MNEVSKCRSCAANIRLCQTVSGESIPVDAEPALDGNIIVGPNGEAAVLTAEEVDHVRRVETSSGEYMRLHRPHFDSCPVASKHRKAR